MLTISLIMMNNPSQFTWARRQFAQLLRQQAFPPKMETKLLFLQAAAIGQPTQHIDLKDLPQYQRDSFQNLDAQGKAVLFSSIVQCFSNSQQLKYFSLVHAYLRKEKTFSGWNACLLSFDGQYLTVYKVKQNNNIWHCFSIQKLQVSKTFVQHKKKFRFGIIYEKVKYDVQLEERKACSRVHTSLINRLKHLKQERGRKSSVAISDIDLSTLQFQKNQQLVDQPNQQARIDDQEKQFLAQMQQILMQDNLQDDSNYKLIMNIPNGRISQNQGTFKTCVLIQRCKIDQLLACYVEFKGWNKQINSIQIVSRIRNNVFLARIKLQKYNFASYPREAFVSITYFKDRSKIDPQSKDAPSSNRHCIVIRSLPQQSVSPGYVAMDFNQTLLISQVDQGSQTAFLIVTTKINYNGYAYLSNNNEITLNFVKQIASLPKYYIQRQMNGDLVCPFDYNYSIENRKSRRSSLNSIIQEERSQIAMPSSYINNKIKVPTSVQQIVQVIQAFFKGQHNQELVEMIKNKVFQKYYLKHRFQQTSAIKIIPKQRQDFLLQGGRWKLSNGQLVFSDQQALKAQKGVLKLILKQITSNIMSGQSIMNMSLPVQIFDRYSVLQLLAYHMGFLAVFVKKAATATSVVQQIKYVALCWMFISVCKPNIQKPFNPILGQTLQTMIGDIPVAFEQISHHPPISTFYIKTPQFQAYGNYEISIEMGLNAAYSKINSLMTMKFNNLKTQYLCKLPEIQMGGLMMGSRTLHTHSKGFVYEKTNDTYLQFSVGKDKKKVYEYSYKIKQHDLAGGIFKVTNNFGKKLVTKSWGKTFDGVKADDVIEKFSQISGKWYGDVYFNQVAYKTIANGPFPVQQTRPAYLLPSDCLFRLDILYKVWGMNDRSNAQKQVLQNLQRKDRKLRQAHGKKH